MRIFDSILKQILVRTVIYLKLNWFGRCYIETAKFVNLRLLSHEDL